jgi:hypothetical protein
MTTSQEQDKPVRNPKLWCASAMKWVLQNPDYRYQILTGIEIEDPAREVGMGEGIDHTEAPDLAGAVAAAHALLDKHAREAGDLGLEISITPPRHPYPEQEQLGVRHYKLSAEARKHARALGIRASDLEPWPDGTPGGDLRARISRMVRHAVPFDHKIANLRYRGVIMRVEDDTVTWIGLAVPPRRPGRPRKTK